MDAQHAENALEDEASSLELVAGWARTTTGSPVRENALPASVMTAVQTLRAEHPDRTVVVLALRTMSDGIETARMGPEKELPPDESLIAVSVINTEVTASYVRVVAHTVVASLDG